MIKILIVEDNLNISNILIQILEDSRIGDFEFKVATSSESAEIAMSSNEFEVIILDGKLIGSHGRDVLNIMTASEKRKAIVHSAEVNFLIEATKQRVDVCRKGDSTSMIDLVKQKLVIY